MATITKFTDESYAPGGEDGKPFSAQYVIDFTEKNAAASDVVQLVNIDAGTVVENVDVYIVTAEGGTCTGTLGDDTDPNGWDASVNLNATAGTLTTGVTGTDALVDDLAAGRGKFYSAANTIDLTLSNAADTAVIQVIVHGYKVSRG